MIAWTELATGLGMVEGPVFLQSGNIAITSFSEGCVIILDNAGVVLKRLLTGGGPNGLVEGSDGRLYVAQNGGRPGANQIEGIYGGVQVIEPSGYVRWLTTDPVAPNDLCFGPDGMLYVTDPTRNGHYNDGRIWRVDPTTGSAEILQSVPWYPNGIGFSPRDELFVASTGDGRIKRMAFGPIGLSVDAEYELGENGPDGFAFEAAGGLVVCCIGMADVTDGHLVALSSTQAINSVERPGRGRLYTNVAVDTKGTILLTDATNGRLLRADWGQPGLPLHPFRSSDGARADSASH